MNRITKRKDGDGKAKFGFGDVTRIGKDIVGGVVARRAGGLGVGMLKFSKQTVNKVNDAMKAASMSADEKELQELLFKKVEEARGLFNLRLQARRTDFSSIVNWKIATVTWNVAEHVPEELVDKLGDMLHKDVQPDILAITLQEVDMSAVAMASVGLVEKARIWEKFLTAQMFHCMPSVPYHLLASEAQCGLTLLIFVKDVHRPHVTNKVVDKSTAGGALSMVGNKGGIAVRFTVAGKRLCFIACHLPAHAGGLEKRHQAYHEMLSEFKFRLLVQADDLLDLCTAPGKCPLAFADRSIKGERGKRKDTSVADHDYIFFIGDLNYRLDADNDVVRKAITDGDCVSLIQYDQLQVSRVERQEVFVGFEEGLLTFPPTYKFDTGTDDYDTSPKFRVPSWTDRVLFACPPQNPEVWAEIANSLKTKGRPSEQSGPLGDDKRRTPKGPVKMSSSPSLLTQREAVQDPSSSTVEVTPPTPTTSGSLEDPSSLTPEASTAPPPTAAPSSTKEASATASSQDHLEAKRHRRAASVDTAVLERELQLCLKVANEKRHRSLTPVRSPKRYHQVQPTNDMPSHQLRAGATRRRQPAEHAKENGNSVALNNPESDGQQCTNSSSRRHSQDRPCLSLEPPEFRGCITQQNYVSWPVRLSDHRPVSALFDVAFISIDREVFDRVTAEVKDLVEPLEEHILTMVQALYPGS
mmetsp:Transcript_60054/g.107139  ORF Transcript_60054/g.107139 Transcript_60054/m.107139 type:complete len:696 (-) Transcript_60054:1781-3868(-)